MEPELDDIVEKSYGPQHLIASSTAASLFVNMMSANAIEPPSSPMKTSTLDPAAILSRDQEQIRRRLEQVSPASGRYFVAMWQSLAEHETRLTPVSDAFNAAREMISALDQILLEVATALADFEEFELPDWPEQSKKPTAAWKRQVFREYLGLAPETVNAWSNLNLHRLAHRSGLGSPRAVTNETLAQARTAEQIAISLLDVYERHSDVIYQQIEKMLNCIPNQKDAHRLASMADANHAVVWQFFERLETAEWWSHLNKAKFFDYPLQPVDTYTHQRWPQSRYLARTASQVKHPANLVDLLLKIGQDTRNVRIHEDLLRAATKFPPKFGQKVLASQSSWPMSVLHTKVARLMGEQEIIRYPAWRAHLLLLVVADQDLKVEVRQKAEKSLRRYLQVNTEVDEQGIFLTTEFMDSAALQHVLLHLREYASSKMKPALLDILIENVREVSSKFGTFYYEPRAETVVDEVMENEDLDPLSEHLLRWYFGATESSFSDNSHLVIRSWLCVRDDQETQALAGLMMGLTWFLADRLEQEGTLPQPSKCAGGPCRLGLLERACLSAILCVTDPPQTVLKELLLKQQMATSAVVREEYSLVLQHMWPRLSDTFRQQVRDVLHDAHGAKENDRFLGLAPLVELDQGISGSEQVLARLQQLTQRPRSFLSAARGQPDPHADNISTQWAPATPLRINETQDDLFVRAEVFLRRETDPTNAEWKELIDVLKNDRRVHREQRPRLTQARWIRIATKWLEEDFWPDEGLRRQLVKFAIGKRMRWSEAVDLQRRELKGSEALQAAEDIPQAQALRLKIVLLTRAESFLTSSQRRRLIVSLQRDIESPAPIRSMFLTYLGLLFPSIFEGAYDLWSDVITPLMKELPDISSYNVEANEKLELSSRAKDLAALYSGLMMGWSAVRVEFISDIELFLAWCYKNFRVLDIPGDVAPLPFVNHAFTLIFSELIALGKSGSALQVILEFAPPLLSVGALRKFAKLDINGGYAKMDSALRRLWFDVTHWAEASPERSVDVMAVIGTWFSNPDFVEMLGREWSVTQLQNVVSKSEALDYPSDVISSLSILVERSPEFADSATELALLLRAKGFLPPSNQAVLQELLDTLSGVENKPNQLAELRACLVADRLIAHT